MPTLHEIQEAFAAVLIAGDFTVAEFVIGDAIAPEARLNIYRNTYLGNLLRALEFSYPAVRKLVGNEFFEGTARAFIDVHPPNSAYLNDYGDAFADFLAQFPPAVSLPYLADVARVEWAVNVALHAEDAPGLDPARLSSLRGDADPILIAHPSVSLVDTAYPADAIWRAVIEEDDAGLNAIDLSEGRIFLVIHRGSDGVFIARLNEDEWRFAQSLFAGIPLSGALNTANTDVAPSLAAHLATGRFTDIQERTPL